jgi:hypothetical protein
MIQLDSRKKIIISAAILLIVVLLVVWLIVKNYQTKNIISKPGIKATTSVITKPEPRLMTDEEKTGVVGIDPSQNAEVLNDQDGIYAYRIKK